MRDRLEAAADLARDFVDPARNRLVLTIVTTIASRSRQSDDLQRVSDAIGLSEAQLRAGGRSVFRGLNGHALVVLRESCDEEEWDSLRSDWAQSARPREILEAVQPRHDAAVQTVATLAEYSIPWTYSALAEEARKVGSSNVAKLIAKQILDTEANILSLSELHSLSEDRHYRKAAALAESLAGRIGPVCGVVAGEHSALALQSRQYHVASAAALKRLDEYDWDLAAHANLILALLAGKDVAEAFQHVDGCGRCNASSDGCRRNPTFGSWGAIWMMESAGRSR